MGIFLGKKFRLKDTRAVKCPLVQEGWIFHTRRLNHPGYRAWLKDQPDLSEKFDPLVEAQMRAQATANLEAGQRRGKVRAEFVEKRRAELAKEYVAGVRLDVGMADLIQDGRLEEGAALLVERIENVKNDEGKVIDPADPELVASLLALELELPFDYEDGDPESERGEYLFIAQNTPLGKAIAQWVVFEAGRTERFHEDWREDAAKNS